MSVPNLITVLRIALIPLLIYLLVERRYGPAFLVLAAAALSDLLDGIVARRSNQITPFGAMLDPVADKGVMLAAVALLAWQQIVPLWLTVAIIVRDIVIVSGAIAYHFVVGRVEMAPTAISKLNTVLEFITVCCALADAARLVDMGRWLPLLYGLVFLTVIASGTHYAWVWARKAVDKTSRVR